jgi:FMN-dependent NADH-azoreductase
MRRLGPDGAVISAAADARLPMRIIISDLVRCRAWTIRVLVRCDSASKSGLDVRAVSTDFALAHSLAHSPRITMPTLLHIDSSADTTDSFTRKMTARFAGAWVARTGGHIIRRDLHTEPLPHLPTNVLHWAPHLRAADATVPAEAAALQRILIDEILAADTLVMGAPMYNWSMPSALKAWLEYIQVAGLTAPYDSKTQPFAGKPIVVVSSRWERYGPPVFDVDYETPALRQILGAALGMRVFVVTVKHNVTARIPALTTGSESATSEGIDLARTAIDALVDQLSDR